MIDTALKPLTTILSIAEGVTMKLILSIVLVLLGVWLFMPDEVKRVIGPDSTTEISGRAYANIHKLLNEYRTESIENMIENMVDDKEITVDEYRDIMTVFKNKHAPLTLLPVTVNKSMYKQDIERDKLISLVLD